MTEKRKEKKGRSRKGQKLSKLSMIQPEIKEKKKGNPGGQDLFGPWPDPQEKDPPKQYMKRTPQKSC